MGEFLFVDIFLRYQFTASTSFPAAAAVDVAAYLACSHLSALGRRTARQIGRELCCRYESMFEHDPTISFWLCFLLLLLLHKWILLLSRGRRTHSRRFDRPQQSRSMYSASCVQCQSDPGGAKNKRWARLNHDFDVVLDSPFLAFLLLFFYFFSISSLYRVGDHLRGLGFF